MGANLQAVTCPRWRVSRSVVFLHLASGLVVLLPGPATSIWQWMKAWGSPNSMLFPIFSSFFLFFWPKCLCVPFIQFLMRPFSKVPEIGVHRDHRTIDQRWGGRCSCAIQVTGQASAEPGAGGFFVVKSQTLGSLNQSNSQIHKMYPLVN